MIKRITFTAILFGSLIINFLAGSPAKAEDRIAELEKMITELSQRVARLEGLIDKNPVADRRINNRLAFGNPDKKENWRMLRTGMTQPQVILILGEPDKIRVNGRSSQWEYGNNYPYNGEVNFLTQSGVVESWREPDFKRLER